MNLPKKLKDAAWFFFVGLIAIVDLYAFYLAFDPINPRPYAGITSVIIVGLLIINDVYSRLKNGALL